MKINQLVSRIYILIPKTYRYINDANDETSAIIYMFNVTTGSPTKEMINLSKDIVEDGLNPFEVPMVCCDEDLEKYDDKFKTQASESVGEVPTEQCVSDAPKALLPE